jgi:protein-tyrosine phosphatase
MIEQERRVEIHIDQTNEPKQFRSDALRLISPGEGEVTFPLQQYAWPEEKDRVLPLENEALDWGQFLIENDRSLPRAVSFAWEFSYQAEYPLHFDLEIAYDADFNQKVTVVHGLTQPNAQVYNLGIGISYYWKVVARASREGDQQQPVLAESPVGHFVTNSTPPRWINVPGVTNVRDIGGWPLPGGHRVRQGMIYRGSELNNHCLISAEGHKILVEDLGILTDMDLRGVGEERGPVLDLRKVEYINIPVMPYESIARPEYTGRYRAAFSLLATRSMYPIFVHCWGGADRTGTVAFLTLALLGVSMEDLATEYELTSLSIWGQRLREAEAFQDLLHTLELFAPKGSSIQTQVERYMKVIGVTAEEVGKIREIMTD